MEARHFVNLVPGRPIHEPEQERRSYYTHNPPPPEEEHSAIKESYDINAVVTVKLWPITVLSTVALVIVFVMIGYYGCTTVEGITCSLTQFPMISDILRQRYIDRVFIFTMVFHGVVVQFSNIRAYHQKFLPVLASSTNNFLYWLGIFACVCEPMIGIIDNHLYRPLHIFFACGFYIAICVYFFILLGQIHSYGMDLLTEKQKQRLMCLYYFRYFMVLFLVVALGSGLYYHDNVPTPFFEWGGTIILMNFFTFTALLDDDYVELVAPREALS